MNNNNKAKKKLMFVTGEDFYFLTYNILTLLKVLQCDGKKSKFRDYRKLALLIDFVSNRNLVSIINRYNGRNSPLNQQDQQLLIKAWSNALVREKLLARLLYALEQRNLVSIEKDKVRKTITVWYNLNDQTQNFFNAKLFESEKRNAKLLKTVIKRLSSITYQTLEEKLYNQYGVNTYGISLN